VALLGGRVRPAANNLFRELRAVVLVIQSRAGINYAAYNIALLRSNNLDLV
jgi:hypothetical protein